MFDFGAVYPGKFKSEGSESFQSELQMLSEESERTSPHFILFYSPQSRLCPLVCEHQRHSKPRGGYLGQFLLGMCRWPL